MRTKKMWLGAIGAVMVLATGVATAAFPDSTAGAPLVGNGQFCSAAVGTSINNGAGSSFAKNANNNVFIPSFAAHCTKESVTYLAGGSGAGKTAFVNRTSYFTMTDEPFTVDETACAAADLGWTNGACADSPSQNRVAGVHHIPLALGAVTLSYNLTGLSGCPQGNEKVSLRSQVISAIFTGLVTKWNDPLLTADNAALSSCNQTIKLEVRSDVSGTTFAFKDYLSKRNPQWNEWKQPSKNLDWPISDAGLGTVIRSSGNGGVANAVKATPGALGYVELSATKAVSNTWALVDGPAPGLNASNSPVLFRSPDDGKEANCVLAAQGAVTPPNTLSPGWDNVSITDTAEPTSYSICTFTYAYVFENLKGAFGASYDKNKGRALVDYLLSDLDTTTQAKLSTNYYAALPENIRQIALLGVAEITDQI